MSLLGNKAGRRSLRAQWFLHLMLVVACLSATSLTNAEAPVAVFNQTSGSWYVQRGDVFLLQGTFGHLETTFTHPPYYSPCPAETTGRNMTFDPDIPDGSLVDCACYPCALHSHRPTHKDDEDNEGISPAWEYCACLEDVVMDVVQVCVAPNSLLLPLELPANTPLVMSVPVAAVKPISSFALELQQSSDIVELQIVYGSHVWLLNTAVTDSLVVCLNSTEDNEEDLFMELRLTPNPGSLIAGTRNYTFSLVFNQVLLPVYLFSNGMQAELVCTDLPPNSFPLTVAPSVTDAAWLLAAQRAGAADQIAQAISAREPNKMNFYLQLTSFNREDMHHYTLFPGVPDVDIVAPSDFYFDMPLQSCQVQLSTAVVAPPGRSSSGSAATGLGRLANLVSASSFCQFQQMLRGDDDFGDDDAPKFVGGRSCNTEVCRFAYAVHEIFDLEYERPSPTFSSLLTWLLPRISDRMARAAVSVSKKSFNTCSYFFWNQLVVTNVSKSALDSNSTECVEEAGTDAWASDPCCNRTMSACCAPRAVMLNTTVWHTNASKADGLCEKCMASFVDPLLSVYPNPIVNCSWDPVRISVQDISNATAVIQRYSQQRVYCDHSLFGNSCSSDQDCPLAGQICSPFRKWCLFTCSSDADCAAITPMSVYYGGTCQSNFCTTSYPQTADALTATANRTIELFLACAVTVRNNLDSSQNPMVEALSAVDAIKVWAMAANTTHPATLTPNEVQTQVLDSVFVSSCYGLAGPSKSPSACADYQCNWAPTATCPYHMSTCLNECQNPETGGNSSYFCQSCTMSTTGPRCQEVSTWQGCYTTVAGASSSPFTNEAFVSDLVTEEECRAAGYRWKENAHNTEETCSMQQPRCSAPLCAGSNCTEETCTSGEFGTCAYINSVPTLLRTFSPGVCILPLQYNTLFEWYCPPNTTPLQYDPDAEDTDTALCLAVQADTPAECTALSTPLSNYTWVDLSTRDTCNAFGYCVGSTGNINPLDRQQCEQCEGGQWRQLVNWRPAKWVLGDPGYTWVARAYTANQNVVARQLNWATIVQVYGSAFMMPYVRSFQRDATCWYGRHFPLYTIAACTCDAELDGRIYPTSVKPGSCFVDYELPVLWATFPFCSNLTATSSYTTVDSPDFLIPNYTVALSPSMRRLCIDLTFSSLVPESQAVIFEGTSTGNFAAVLAGSKFDENSYLHVYNSKQVKVGVLSGNGVRSIFEPNLRFEEDARLPICFYSTPSNTELTPLLTGCSDLGSSDYVQVVRRPQIVREGPIVNQTNITDIVCIYMDTEQDLYPCQTLRRPRSITLFDNYSPAQAAGLIITAATFTLAALFTVFLFFLVHWPIWTHFRLSTSVLLFLLSFLLFSFYAVYFFVIMFGVLDSESPFENFLNLAPIVLSFNMISILLTRWLALGLTSVARRERRLPKKVFIPISLCNVLLYIWMLLVVVGSAFSHSQPTSICQPDQPHNWLYYVSYTLRIFLVIVSAVMIIACIVSGVQIYRVLESSTPSRRGFRRIYLFFGLQACVLFALFGQSGLQLMFFVVPSTLTFATALIGSVFVSLMPIAILNILIYYASRVSKSRIASDRPWSIDRQAPASSAGLLADEDDDSTAPNPEGRDVLDELNTEDTHPMISYITQDDWSVV